MTLFSQCRKLVLGSMLFCVLVIAGGCKEAPLKPVNISSNDVCYYCKGPFDLSQERYAAEMIAKDGFVRKFDDIACLVANAKKVGLKNIKVIYAVDLQTKTWLPADQLQFVRSDRIATPKNGGIVAIRDIEQAKQIASKTNGELVQLSDLIK
jgi:hypothetical protein